MGTRRPGARSVNPAEGGMKPNSHGRQPVEPVACIQSSPRRGRHMARVECGAPCGSSGVIGPAGIHGLTPEARGVSPLSGLMGARVEAILAENGVQPLSGLRRKSRCHLRCKERARSCQGLIQTSRPCAHGTVGRMLEVQTVAVTFSTLPEPFSPDRSQIRHPILPSAAPLKYSHTRGCVSLVGRSAF